MSWSSFWHWVLWAALISYFGLAVVISIGGFFDVKRMFRRLDAAHEAEKNAANTPSAEG